MAMFGSSWIEECDDRPIGRPIHDDDDYDVVYSPTEGEEDFN